MTMRTGNQSWLNEEKERKSIDIKKICKFGIQCLDNTLFGILKKDFIVIGADSGAGKSEVCLKIAIHNAKEGRKVGLYFIEGGDIEAIARIKWSLICDRYYKNKMTGLDMNYRKWRMNMIKEPLMDKLEQDCHEEIESVLENIMLYGYEKGLSIQNFIDSLDYFLKPEEGFEDDPFSYSHKVDIIIIDHLQYFNLSNPNKELSEQSEILKKVNEIAHGFSVPVILVSHLRKKEKDRGLPNQEDFYGTSNTPKMSSIAITMTSTPSPDGKNYPTYFRVVKSRTKIPSNYALLCDYNLELGNYEDKYSCYRLSFDKPEKYPLLSKDIPGCFNRATPRDPSIKIDKSIKEEDVHWQD